MDLIERVETTRFLGNEFLLWLWHEQHSGSGAPRGDQPQVTLAAPLRLAEPLTPAENVVIQGRDPCGSAEAQESLLSGKLPVKATLHLESSTEAFSCTLDAGQWAIAALKLPERQSADEDRLASRMEQLEQVQDWLDGHFKRFLERRLGPRWNTDDLPKLKRWVSGRGL